MITSYRKKRDEGNRQLAIFILFFCVSLFCSILQQTADFVWFSLSHFLLSIPFSFTMH